MVPSYWYVIHLLIPNAMILLIDNYDSFVFNLARYFQRLGASPAMR